MFINDATVIVPRVEIDLTKRRESYLSDYDIIRRDFQSAFEMAKYFEFNETFMLIFGAEYSRTLSWYTSKLRDVIECHKSAFYDAFIHALSITEQNASFDLVQDIFHKVIIAWKNTGSFVEPEDVKVVKPFDVVIYEYKNNNQNIIWQHSYR